MERARRLPSTREALALVEWTRICREIEALESIERDASEHGVLAALRMCRLYLERQLTERGWARRGGRWVHAGAAPPSAA